MIILGYLIIFTYIFLLIFLIGPLIKKVTNLETSRKIIHIFLFMVWVFIDLFMKNTIHQVIVPIIFLILNSLSYKFNIYKSVEREDNNHFGTIYFAIAITIIMFLSLLFPKYYYASGIAVFALTFGDGFAALIGYNTNTKKICKDKSISGFISCFVATTFSTYIFSSFYGLEINFIICILIGLAVSIFELIGKGLDNFSVVFISFIMGYLFLNYRSSILVFSILLSEFIFMIVFFSKSIDYYGSLLSMIMVFSYMYFGEVIGISILLSEYFFIFFISILRKKLNKHKNKDSRKFLQILINGGLGTLFIILYGIFKSTNLLIISIISVSGCFIDSVSSDVGTLSKGKTYDILKRKKIEKGISGGISILGTVSSFLCTVLISLTLYVVLNLNIYDLIIITCLIFGQTIIDSLIGSSIQVKYKCIKCGKINEKGKCCNEISKKISGISWINNNMVNLMSSIIITFISIIIYI